MNTNKTTWLFNGDCLDILPKITSKSIDLILTDPPYLSNYIDRSGRSIRNDIRSNWLKPTFINLYRVLKNDSFCISFYGLYQVEKFMLAWKTAGFRPVGHLVFPKKYPSKRGFVKSTHECAFILAKGNPKKSANPMWDVVYGWKFTGNNLHPTQKPVGIMEMIISQFSSKNQMVLDPFCGSATVGVACKNRGRKYIGIEIDEYYFKKAHERIKKMGQ